MRKVLIIFILCIYSALSFADRITFATETREKQRYEIMLSPLAVKWTFLIDKYTGNMWQLAKYSNTEEIAWIRINFIDNNVPRIDKSKATYCRFQFITSNLTGKDMYLLDTQNGDTWQIVSMSSDDDVVCLLKLNIHK